jgi:site-specific DNA recombinase
MSAKPRLMGQITSAMQTIVSPISGQTLSMADIEQRLEELNEKMKSTLANGAKSGDLAACSARFRILTEEMTVLKEKKERVLKQGSNTYMARRVAQATRVIETVSPDIREWDESLIRQLVNTVTVLSAQKIKACLRGGVEIEQELRV